MVSFPYTQHFAAVDKKKKSVEKLGNKLQVDSALVRGTTHPEMIYCSETEISCVWVTWPINIIMKKIARHKSYLQRKLSFPDFFPLTRSVDCKEKLLRSSWFKAFSFYVEQALLCLKIPFTKSWQLTNYWVADI